MKQFSFISEPGVLLGKENNSDLFIRKTIFDKGYTEKDFHNHPNSFEFYFVLEGSLKFTNSVTEITATHGSIVYFEEAEPHRITEVTKKAVLLLIKRVGSTKS